MLEQTKKERRKPGARVPKDFLSEGERRILAERTTALEKVLEETWTASHRGVELGGPVHFRHCNLSAEVSHHVQAARERVAATAPAGVRLARGLVDLLEGVATGEKSSVDREKMGQVYEAAVRLLNRLGTEDQS